MSSRDIDITNRQQLKKSWFTMMWLTGTVVRAVRRWRTVLTVLWAVLYLMQREVWMRLIVSREQYEKFLRYRYFNYWKQTASKLKKLKKLHMKPYFNLWVEYFNVLMEEEDVECPLCILRVPKIRCCITLCNHRYCNDCFIK